MQGCVNSNAMVTQPFIVCCVQSANFLSPDSYRYRGSFYEEPTTVKPVIMIYEVNTVY